MKKEKVEKSKYEEIMKEFPLLFAQRNLDMTQTCMCWGIECGEGWYYPLYELCLKLETINEYVGLKNGFTIQAEQIKEKFGTLRFYWTFNIKSFRFGGKIVNFLNKKFGENSLNNLKSLLQFGCLYKTVQKRLHLREVLRDEIENMINETEVRCICHCKNCGTEIGTLYSPRYETAGWISYICEKCAKKLPSENVRLYMTNSELEKIKNVDLKIYKKFSSIISEQKKEQKKVEKKIKGKLNKSTSKKKNIKVEKENLTKNEN